MANQENEVPIDINEASALAILDASYRLAWALPLGSGTLIVALLNVIANVPKPNDAVTALAWPLTLLSIAASIGAVTVFIGATWHQIVARVVALKAEISNPTLSIEEAELRRMVGAQRKLAAGFTVAFGLLTLAGGVTLAFAIGLLCYGALSGAPLQR